MLPPPPNACSNSTIRAAVNFLGHGPVSFRNGPNGALTHTQSVSQPAIQPATALSAISLFTTYESLSDVDIEMEIT